MNNNQINQIVYFFPFEFLQTKADHVDIGARFGRIDRHAEFRDPRRRRLFDGETVPLRLTFQRPSLF